MKKEYAINADGICIGRATVVPLGLYYDIACTCKPQSGIVRIIANCTDHTENIGICVPKNGELVIHTKIPQKRLQSISDFAAITQTQEDWIPIVDGKPIAHLDKIRYAKFCVRNGQPGLSIPLAKLRKNR